jgi:hypothetical protein
MGRIKVCLGLLFVVFASASPVFADSVQVQYTVTGTFSSSVGSAPLSGADGTYSMNFALPQMPTPDYVDTTAGDFAIMNVPISYSFQCQGCSSATNFSGTAEDVDFAGPSLGGMFVVEFLTGGHDYYFQFAGDTLFTGSVDQPTLLPGGPFNLTNAELFGLDDNEFVDLGSATVQGVATPEPSTLALLLTAAATLGLFALFKLQRA